MTFLNKKKVLFLTTSLYEYPYKIKASIERLGGEVILLFFNRKTPISTFLLNTNGSLYKSYRRFEEENMLKNISNDRFDYILIQHPYWLSHSFLSNLREKFKDAKFINYNWDSIRTGNYLEYSDYFDKILSFDRRDVEKYQHLEYLPLFYTEEFKNIRRLRENVYDIVFIGTIGISSERYEFIQNLISKYYDFRFLTYLYMNRNKFVKTILFKNKIYKNVHFKALNLKSISDIYRKARVVVDYNNPLQSGLTMRTFEVLGAGRKLITTNRNIIDEPFYNESIINVIDVKNPIIEKEFITEESNVEPFDINRYYIDNWVLNVFK